MFFCEPFCFIIYFYLCKLAGAAKQLRVRNKSGAIRDFYEVYEPSN